MNDAPILVDLGSVSAEPSLTGIAAKGKEIAGHMLSEEIGSGWRFGDLLTFAFQVTNQLPPGQAAMLTAQVLELVLHNSFVKARIPPYDRAPKVDATPGISEEIGP